MYRVYLSHSSKIKEPVPWTYLTFLVVLHWEHLDSCYSLNRKVPSHGEDLSSVGPPFLIVAMANLRVYYFLIHISGVENRLCFTLSDNSQILKYISSWISIFGGSHDGNWAVSKIYEQFNKFTKFHSYGATYWWIKELADKHRHAHQGEPKVGQDRNGHRLGFSRITN